jgi:hypothetical protein
MKIAVTQELAVLRCTQVKPLKGALITQASITNLT